MSETIPLFSALALAPLMLLLFWCSLRWLLQIPSEDRQWLDRPPLGFLVIWPLIRVLVFVLAPVMSTLPTNRLSAHLAQAGVEFRITSAQFRAAQCVSALFTALVFYLGASESMLLIPVLVVVGAGYPCQWLHEVRHNRRRLIVRELPHYLDIIILSVEAGTSLVGAITQVTDKAVPGPLKDECNRVLREIRSGRTRADALRALAVRLDVPSVRRIVSGVIQSEQSGSSLGPVLRLQANQLRRERYALAEKKALQAPVKMLLPLVLFIFPTTFLVIGFILLSKAIQGQMLTHPLLVWAYHWTP